MVVIIKPTYSCNFNCRYCYLSEESKTKNKFDVEFAKKALLQIKECFLTDNKRRLTIIWHGGEPLLWGIENYREIFSFIENEFKDYKFQNSMQSNLSLINEDFIELFLKYDVHLGFSLDGPEEINDFQRVYKNGSGTFKTVIEKIALCKEKKLRIGCIVVATKKHIGKIQELYQFMCKNNIGFKLNPLFKSGEAKKNVDDLGITPEEYAKMSAELFDLWFYDKVNKNNNSNFAEIASNIIAKKPSGCMFGKNCQDNFLAISPNGDVVPCGRFCDNDLIEYSYGNLHNENLKDILPRIKLSSSYNRFEYIEASSCRRCRFFDICHGGCMHDGFLVNNDFKTKTFLCNAYKKIFMHISKRLKESGVFEESSDARKNLPRSGATIAKTVFPGAWQGR
jgi:uncharacterized protein